MGMVGAGQGGTGRPVGPFSPPGDGQSLPGFPGSYRTRAKTPMPGGRLRPRWKTPNGRILEWDYRHGTAPLKRIIGAGGIWENSIRPMVRYGAVRSRDKRWIPNMRYRVIWYNRTTDRVGGLVEIPGVLLSRVLKIAGVTDRNEPGELLLEPRQISDIASLVGLHIDLARFEYHLDPLGPFPQRLRA